MNVNCVNIEREAESLKITNINISIRFNKTPVIFPSVTRVLSILPTTAATSVSVERLNSKTCIKPVRFLLPAIQRGALSAAITC